MAIVDINQYIITNSSSKVEIEIINYTLNSNAVAKVSFLDADNKVISSVLVYVSGTDFNIEWNTDDDLINIVLAKLGLSRV